MKKWPSLFLFPVFFWFLTSYTHADFSDVSKDSEYFEAITELTNLGVIEGYPDGHFYPDQIVNRAEFLKMAYLSRTLSDSNFSKADLDALKDQVKNLNCFSDVTENLWFAPYVCWGKSEGYLKGYPDGTFKPNQLVSVMEAAKMISMKVDDESSQPHWAISYLEALGPYRIPSSIHSAEQVITRAEASEMIWRYFFSSKANAKKSTILLWNNTNFLPFEYLGKECHYAFCVFYLKRHFTSEIYTIGEYESDHPLTKLESVDLESFKILNADVIDLALDKNSLYYLGKKVEGSGGGFFELLSTDFSDSLSTTKFARDKKNIYPISCYEGCWLKNFFPNADLDSFKFLDRYYYRDKNNIYFFYSGFKSSDPPIILQEADLASFEVLGDGYGKDKNRIYYWGASIDADFSTFTYDSELDLAYDNNSVFQGGEPVPESAGGYLKKIGEGSNDDDYYIRDQGRVYLASCDKYGCYYGLLPNSDPDNFQILDDGYSRDAQHLYHHLRLLEGISPDGFEQLSFDENSICDSPFIKNDDYVYLNEKPLVDIDLGSFEILHEDGFFVKDKNGIYRVIDTENIPSFCERNALKEVENIDESTFDVLNYNYIISGQSVYFIDSDANLTKVDADYDSFHTHFYSEDSKYDLKRATWPIAFDSNTVFAWGKAISELDLQTISFDPEQVSSQNSGWSDKNGSYTWDDIQNMYRNS